MTHEKWFISDTHFFHTNILKFTDGNGKCIRPFNSLNEMHEYMIKQWNSVVGKNDYVYHLGDVTFQYHKGFNELMSQLNGAKRLVVGNHDKIWNPNLMRWFEKADLWKGFKDFDFTASHIPLRLESLRDGNYNVHGHTHTNVLEDPHYINVCVEQVDYKPIHIEEIASKIKSATYKLSNK